MSKNHLPLLRSRRWQHTRRAAFERDGWRCRECHRPGRLEATTSHPCALAAIPTIWLGS